MNTQRSLLGLCVIAAATAIPFSDALGDQETASLFVPLNTTVGHQQEAGFTFDLSGLPAMQEIHSASLRIGAGGVDNRLPDPVFCGPRQYIGLLAIGDAVTSIPLVADLGGSAGFDYLRQPSLPVWVNANELDSVMVQAEWWEDLYCPVWIPQTCYYEQPRYCDRYICDFWLFGSCISGHWERYQCGVDRIPYDCGYWTNQWCGHQYHPPVYEDRPGSLWLSWARLDVVYTPPICPADMNQDGGVDGEDVNAFFAVWEAGEEAADLNTDGGVDFADVTFFFEHWEAGC
ncbi:MAG: hypothetical protein NTV94_00235 [Planctomycetota bacterium]|nr:hypothetical protein [Planctomycetota bacterium]